jgi:hypothetical protein
MIFVVGWSESRMVYEVDYKKPWPILSQYVIGKLSVVPVGDTVTMELFRTACATLFRAPPATAGRAQAMEAGCGSSTRGHWDGPIMMICNKSHGIAAAGRKVQMSKAVHRFLQGADLNIGAPTTWISQYFCCHACMHSGFQTQFMYPYTTFVCRWDQI